MPEKMEGKVQYKHCRQADAQVIEPGADSTLLLVVVVAGVRSQQKYREVGREYRQSE